MSGIVFNASKTKGNQMKTINSALIYTPLLLACLFIAACSTTGTLITSDLRVTEKFSNCCVDSEVGASILAVAVTPVEKEVVLQLFNDNDFSAVGINSDDIDNQTVYFVSPWTDNPRGQGMFAFLINQEIAQLNAGKGTTNCNPTCNYGGDLVSIKRIKASQDGNRERLYIVDEVVMPRQQFIDAPVGENCDYHRRFQTVAVACKSLEPLGWDWYGEVFMKLPDSNN